MRAYKKPGRQRCSVGDCGQSLYCRAMCVMHYTRWRKTGDPGEPSRRRGVFGDGCINEHGYRVRYSPDHPLARAQGKVLEHRVVLFDDIGEGPHPCHWCGIQLTWSGTPGQRINVDHLDGEKLNNELSNLVPSCLDCNTKREAAA